MPSGLEAKSKEVDFGGFRSARLRLQQSAPLEVQCCVVLELLPFGALKELDEHVSMMIQDFLSNLQCSSSQVHLSCMVYVPSSNDRGGEVRENRVRWSAQLGDDAIRHIFRVDIHLQELDIW